ncbi:hypothetical protein BDZ89DRAFT_1101087 [Hymenopellis radicata]|nr:hypothetical protein BDZ89DRAFT_1101087 [Hymenopellis radicata]
MLSVALALTLIAAVAAQDPCATIGGQKWVTPAQLRACYSSFAVNENERSNIIEVVNKTLAFHTSTNYEFQAPSPYADTHEDIAADLARIGFQDYDSDYDLHIDISRALKRFNDGHCVWINLCYDSAFINYLPTPLVLVNGEEVHIASEAYDVASAEFADQLSAWEEAISSSVEGGLKALNGAKVLQINGADPFEAVNANALIAGGYQGFGTRQNGFFASYQRSTSTWTYLLGNFAQQSLPLSDSVELLVQLEGATETQSVVIPYFSRIGSSTVPFTDGASFRAGNCLADNDTNGANYYDQADTSRSSMAKVQQAPVTEGAHPVNVLLDSSPLTDVEPVSGFGVGEFYMLADNTTGVLALGSFSGAGYNDMMQGLLDGLVTLKSNGAERLIVDVTNNGGGYICVAHFLHRIIVGPKSTTVPQAGLNTTARDPVLARHIVQNIVDAPDTVDPSTVMLYNPLNWWDLDNAQFGPDVNWLEPPVEKVVNGRPDAFSQTLGTDCPPELSFPTDAPDSALFDGSQVAIVSNGRCGSSCSLFSITMAKLEGSTTVVVGGKSDVDQKYCGTVGGQSTVFTTIDSEIKTAGLKDDAAAPPDLIVNGVLGITWRLGYGIVDPTQPEEWQDRPANINLPLTLDLANNPAAIWDTVAKLF